jgi:hypothetical protein
MAVKDQAAKVAKTHDSSTSFKSPVPKKQTIGSPRPPSAKKGAYGASATNQQPADQPADGKKKVTDDKEVPVGPATQTRNSRSAQAWRPNRNSRSSLFSGKIWMPLHGRYQICPESPER